MTGMDEAAPETRFEKPAGRLHPPRWLGPAIAVAVLTLAAVLLWRTLGNYSAARLAASIEAASLARLGAAALFAALSYLCLGLFDWLALRYAGRSQPWRRAALASFCALSIGHNLGFAALSSGAVRYRFYSRFGLSAGEVARVIVFCGATVGLGLLGLAALVFLGRPGLVTGLTGLPWPVVLGLGAGCSVLVCAYLALAALARRPLRLRAWSLRMPGFWLALAQLSAGTLNFALVAACLHQALSAVATVSYPQATAAYLLANAGILVSHVPGGIGVLEAVVTFLLPNADIIAGLLLFRLVYYLVPLALGGATFALTEIMARRSRRFNASAGPAGAARRRA